MIMSKPRNKNASKVDCFFIPLLNELKSRCQSLDSDKTEIRKELTDAINELNKVKARERYTEEEFNVAITRVSLNKMLLEDAKKDWDIAHQRYMDCRTLYKNIQRAMNERYNDGLKDGKRAAYDDGFWDGFVLAEK